MYRRIITYFRSVHPALPSGIHKFKGQILHSQEYRIPDAFRGKRILVVGLGNTGGDVAVELSGIAAQVLFLNQGLHSHQHG